jgi:hypothetical protein
MPGEIPITSETAAAQVRITHQPAPKAPAVQAVPAAVAVGGSGTPETATDIDTELDSVEVATEVDENEVVEEVDVEEEVEGTGEEGNDEDRASERDAAELAELLRTQSAAPLEAFAYFGGEGDGLQRGYTYDLRGRQLVPSQSIYRSESILSVDLGIARLGSLRSLNPESFSWSQ